MRVHRRSGCDAVGLVVMTVLTVEAHLSRTYRKLGVRSRAALAGRLAASGGQGPKQ